MTEYRQNRAALHRKWNQERKEYAPYKSGLEHQVAKELEGLGLDFEYEPFKIPFLQPAKPRTYTPDFVLPNGIIIEVKGEWPTAERQKFGFVADTHPDLDIRFVFSRSKTRIGKKSTTTYASYCDKRGWLYADKSIPLEWLQERHSARRLYAIRKIRNGK